MQPIGLETRFADGFDSKDIIDFLHAAARSVGAEVTSPWFYLQFGLILAARRHRLCGRTPRFARAST